MGVYISNKTYKDVLPILASTGEVIDTREIFDLDLVRCGECVHCVDWWYCLLHDRKAETSDFCSFGERRADDKTEESRP